jgi:hypothetical protein
MSLADDIAHIGALLDAFAETHDRTGVAAEDDESAGVPPSMQAGPVNADGWVKWRMLPSTLTEGDVAALEAAFGVAFPPLFRAWLLARFHLFDQVRSARHGQLIFMTAVPSGARLGPLRALLRAWHPLIGAGFAPFAEWGDGWGPMCFDVQQRADDGDCPIVWLDHERLVPLGAASRQRAAVVPLAQPLYGSFRELLADVFWGAR